MKVYVVGDHGPEHNSIKSIHKTYKKAAEAWNKIRLKLLGEARSSLESDRGYMSKEMWQEIVDNLSCENPDKIDNYPQETPYIKEFEVEE